MWERVAPAISAELWQASRLQVPNGGIPLLLSIQAFRKILFELGLNLIFSKQPYLHHLTLA
jgi:hypothetical protein